jgi:hypothetical protein
MKIETRDRLRKLAERRDKEYGKLVQKLLAIAFLEAGATRVVERSVQGIDLEVTIEARRLALEVKTTESGSIKLGKKDVDGLLARRDEGFEVFVAVLGRELLDEWIIAGFVEGEIPDSKKIETVLLRPYRDSRVETAIADRFEEALAQHLSKAVEEGGQGHLDEVLEGYGEAYARA